MSKVRLPFFFLLLEFLDFHNFSGSRPFHKFGSASIGPIHGRNMSGFLVVSSDLAGASGTPGSLNRVAPTLGLDLRGFRIGDHFSGMALLLLAPSTESEFRRFRCPAFLFSPFTRLPRLLGTCVVLFRGGGSSSTLGWPPASCRARSSWIPRAP